MLLAQSYYHQQPLDHHHHSLRSRKPVDVETRVPIDLDDIDFAIDIDQPAQLGQFPEVQASTQSLLPQLSALFNFAAPSHTDGNLATGHDWASLQTSHQPALAAVDGLDGNDTNMMQHGDASWLIPSHITPKSAGRFSHQRESSLSSLGSAGPASPYSHNSSNPQIAVTDSAPDTYHGMPSHDDFHYQLASKVSGDGFYGYQPYPTDTVNTATTAYLAALRSQREADRGLLPPPEFPTKSRPVSVASSVNSESPATPALLEPEDDGRRNRNVMQQTAVPKLARTMTDIYSDELYNPNFTITSAPPSQPSQLVAMSPTNEIFAQRLQAANSQHLSAAQSPVSSISRGRSPFRQGSPLAPAPSQEFPTHMGAPQLRFGSAQKAREQRKAELDAQARQQLSRGSEASTPQTISPKDALLDYHDGDGDSDFPLFPQPSTVGNVSEHANSGFATGTQGFHTIGFDSSNVSRAPAPAQLPLSVPIPQQYPFISQPRQPVDGNLPLVPTLTSRISSMDSNVTEFVQRPHAGTGADGGTYTCTYHGCTLRFETPAMLQKHKREGHRQAHGLGSLARHNDSGIGTSAMVTSPAAGMTSSLLNTQAGPHKCERINPSTGKPCNTIFSRPYDLTRHEDTIHNARKQKVRCDLCTDEKTFSRADALTRHYRVCHPEVEFPGKARRRSARGT